MRHMRSPREVLRHFIPRVDTLDSRESFFQIQFELLDWLIECEREISKERDKPEVRRPGPLSVDANMDEMLRAQSTLDDAEQAKHLLLHIGDSLAWIMLSREFIRGSSAMRK